MFAFLFKRLFLFSSLFFLLDSSFLILSRLKFCLIPSFGVILLDVFFIEPVRR